MTLPPHHRQLFCDFGKDFTVQDLTEEEPLTAAIQHISQVGAKVWAEEGPPEPVEGSYRHL